jgi:hypothetical protein
MSTTICLVASTLEYLEAGGHLSVYVNWALGLRALGCEVFWLEKVAPGANAQEVQHAVRTLKNRLEPFGLDPCVALCGQDGAGLPGEMLEGCFDLDAAAEADLLLNVSYKVGPQVVRRFRRSALVDIDPGLLQLWLSEGQTEIAPHTIYFTIGETVGTKEAHFPDAGLRWHYSPPVVFLPLWPVAPAPASARYTTVSAWWGGWESLNGHIFNNEKRTSFLEYLHLPSRTSARLELALGLWNEHEHEDRRLLQQNGWNVRHAFEVSSTPEDYRDYIHGSRGEFSCAKPSCMRLANAWVSDRTLCYLASGKPAIVQHTGPSRFLPDAEGLFRFRNLDEAARALTAAESDYERHCRQARALAEEYFDARKVLAKLLERALA